MKKVGIEQLRNYSCIFSRSVFSDIVDYNDYSRLDTLFERYDSDMNRNWTYFDYIKYIYHILSNNYRCEYVYKNEIICKLLLKKDGTKNSIAINEFRVQNSIVDFVLFNEESRAFEIKTEYDNKKRLNRQIQDYTKLFQKCYVVIPEQLQKKYEESVSDNIGIIVLISNKSKIKLEMIREAVENEHIDINVLMHSIRTSEYKDIVLQYFGELPNVSCYEMFERCQEKIGQIPQENLHNFFIEVIKKRKNNTQVLETFFPEIRQMCLNMNLTQKQYTNLQNKLNNPIIL